MGTPVETNNQPTTPNNTRDEEFPDDCISEHCPGQARPWRSSPRSSSRCPPSTSCSPPRCPPRCPPSTSNSPPYCPLSCAADASPCRPPPCCPPPPATCPP